MNKSSRMSIEYKLGDTTTIQFGELEIGDVFHVIGEDRLYMVMQVPSCARPIKQSVSLDNGGRRAFNEHTACVQVKVICSWVNMQP